MFLLAAVALNPFVLVTDFNNIWTMKALISSILPVALGGTLASGIWLNNRYQWLSWSLRHPQADQLLAVENALGLIIKSGRSFALQILPKWRMFFLAGCNRLYEQSELWFILDSSEKRLGYWIVGITLFVMLGMIFVFLSAQG